MTRQQRCVILIFLAFMASLPINVSAWIKNNQSEIAFDETEVDTGTTESVQSRLAEGSGMARLIVQGAGEFLDSHSQFLTFLKKYEVSEIESISQDELKQWLDHSITAMEKATATYGRLKYTADRTPYRYDTFWKLIYFDYSYFQYYQDLNKDVFSKVARFLGRGDVRGCYGHVLENCKEILDSLRNVKESLKVGDRENLRKIWRLNQKYSDALLFGQYVAEVFYEIK